MEKIWVKIQDQRIIERYNPNKGYIINLITKVYHSNPTEEQFLECGYRELIFLPEEEHLPEKEGYYIDTIYEDNGTQAIEKELYIEESEPEDEEIPPEEYFAPSEEEEEDFFEYE